MTDEFSMDGTNRRDARTRRRFLATSAALGATGLFAGCQGLTGDGTSTEAPGDDENGTESAGTDSDGEDSGPGWYGSGPGAFDERPVPGGTSMEDMPDLSGELHVYSGRGQGLVGDLLAYLEERYPDFDVNPTYESASNLANRILTEGDNSPADVFYSVNAGALGQLASEGRTESLADETASLVGEEFRADDADWVGTSGRARTVPYNTDALSASDVPEDIMAFPDLGDYEGEIGWAPTYSSFQGFITAMLELEGEEATREWLRGMQDLDVQEYPNEFAVSQAVADGELSLGFANHYYIQRVLAGQPEASISTAFTQNDAGTIFNVAGAARIDSSDDSELADLFVRHLLSSEAQEYFAVRTFEYPLVDGVDPIGELPPISELAVPDVDLAQLSDLDRTIDILRDEGVL